LAGFSIVNWDVLEVTAEEKVRDFLRILGG
jgi:hypothetical protein